MRTLIVFVLTALIATTASAAPQGLLQQERLQRAWDYYEAIRLGRRLLAEGKPQEALQKFEYAQSTDGSIADDPMLLQYLGIAKGKVGRLQEGLADLERGKALGRNSDMMSIARMELHLKLGDQAGARKALEEIVADDITPQAAPFLANSAYLNATGDQAGSERELLKGISLAPEERKPFLYFRLYVEYERTAQFEKAMLAHDEYLRRGGSSAIAKREDPAGKAEDANNACWIRALAGVDLERAMAYCDSAIALGQGLRKAPSLNSRAVLNLKIQRYEAAIEDFNAAMRLRAGRAIDIYGRAYAYEKLGRSTAQREMERALSIDANVGVKYAEYGLEP